MKEIWKGVAYNINDLGMTLVITELHFSAFFFFKAWELCAWQFSLHFISLYKCKYLKSS